MIFSSFASETIQQTDVYRFFPTDFFRILFQEYSTGRQASGIVLNSYGYFPRFKAINSIKIKLSPCPNHPANLTEDRQQKGDCHTANNLK